jgi:hypothetical protein
METNLGGDDILLAEKIKCFYIDIKKLLNLGKGNDQSLIRKLL